MVQFKFISSFLGCVHYEVIPLNGASFRIEHRNQFSEYERSITNYSDEETKDRMVGDTVGMIHRVGNPCEPLAVELVAAFNAWRDARWAASMETMRRHPEKYGDFFDDPGFQRPVHVGAIHLVKICPADEQGPAQYVWQIDVPIPRDEKMNDSNQA